MFLKPEDSQGVSGLYGKFSTGRRKPRLLLNLPESLFHPVSKPVLYLKWRSFFYYGCKSNISSILIGENEYLYARNGLEISRYLYFINQVTE